MAPERFYIHRCGMTDLCAISAVKNESRLPAASCPDTWKFWLQVTRNQTEDGRFGFVFSIAVAKIALDGFFVFTGSPKLLGLSRLLNFWPADMLRRI